MLVVFLIFSDFSSVIFVISLQRLHLLEDPYLRTRDSRTDIKIRPSSVRKRDPHDLESDYLSTKAVQKSNGAKSNQHYSNYYNTSPSGSQPSASAGKVCQVLAYIPHPLHVCICV